MVYAPSFVVNLVLKADSVAVSGGLLKGLRLICEGPSTQIQSYQFPNTIPAMYFGAGYSMIFGYLDDASSLTKDLGLVSGMPPSPIFRCFQKL